MDVLLSPELESFVRARVDSGQYRSPDEVVGEALRLLEERELRLEQLRREIQKGIDSGPAVPFDGEALKKRVMEKLNERQPA